MAMGINVAIQDPMAELLAHARASVARRQDQAAMQSYLDLLRADPLHHAALSELGALALTNGHRSAARTLFERGVQHYPGDIAARVTLGNMALEDEDAALARAHYEGALAHDPACPEALQGMARALSALGEEARAEPFRTLGFSGHAIARRHYRGVAPAIELLFIASVGGGNVKLRRWLDDRTMAVTVIYAEYLDADQQLPPHDLIINGFGDVDFSAAVLPAAQAVVARSTAPVINHPEVVARTGRENIARLCREIEGLIAPRIKTMSRKSLTAATDLKFPLLLRSPGFHTGQHFVKLMERAGIGGAINSLPGDALLAIEYLDARGCDGMARKYRVMFIDNVIYPLHLAISSDWKIHYFTAEMTDNADFREEERRFLQDMPGALGPRAMNALASLRDVLGLDYGGADFALSATGDVLLFEANATMAMVPPPPGEIWDYRRPAALAAQRAVHDMVLRRAQKT